MEAAPVQTKLKTHVTRANSLTIATTVVDLKKVKRRQKGQKTHSFVAFLFFKISLVITGPMLWASGDSRIYIPRRCLIQFECCALPGLTKELDRNMHPSESLLEFIVRWLQKNIFCFQKAGGQLLKFGMRFVDLKCLIRRYSGGCLTSALVASVGLIGIYLMLVPISDR